MEKEMKKKVYKKPQLTKHESLKEITAGSVSQVVISDKRLKNNIDKLDSRTALTKLLQLQGVSWEWANPEEHCGELKTGLLAQNMQSVFPDWVKTFEPNGADRGLIPAGEKALAISFPVEFNAYLIEAIRAQQQQLDTQQAQIEELHAEVEVLKALLDVPGQDRILRSIK